MSWSFSATGKNRAETFAALKTAAEQYARPPEQVAQIVGYAEALAAGMPDESVTLVATYGHLNADGSGNVNVSINT